MPYLPQCMEILAGIFLCGKMFMSNARGLGPLASSRHGSDQPGLVTSEPLGLVTSESGAPVHTNFLPHSPLASACSPLARPLARLTAHPKFTVEGRWKHELNAVQRLCPMRHASLTCSRPSVTPVREICCSGAPKPCPNTARFLGP